MNGLQVLTDTLGAKLSEAVRLQSPLTGLRQTGEGWTVTTRNAGGETQHAHAAVFVHRPGAQAAGNKLTTERSVQWSPLGRFATAVASLVLVFAARTVAHPWTASAMLIPELERFSILGALFSSSLFPNRAPAGHVTLTCYLGGTRAPKLAPRCRCGGRTGAKGPSRDSWSQSEPTFRHHFIFQKAIPPIRSRVWPV